MALLHVKVPVNGTLKRVLRWFAAVALFLLVLMGALAFAFHREFHPSLPTPNFPPPRDVAEAQRQDLDYFRNYFEYNRAYSSAAKGAAQAVLQQYEAQAGTLSPAAFDLAIARMVALSDNGHSSVSMNGLSRRHNRLPCRLYRFSDGLYVIRARGACVALLGAKLLAIDGKAVEEVADRMFEFSGGPRNRYDQLRAAFFFESPELLNAAGVAREVDRVTLRLALPDGQTREETVTALPADPQAPRVSSDASLSPRPIAAEPEGWTPLLAPDAGLPLFLADYDNPFQSRDLSTPGVFYVQFKSNDNEPGHPIGEFVAQVERELVEHKPRVVIVDLRLDQGGNYLTTASFMKRLPSSVDSIQHVYVLTSAWTFSAGNTSVAFLKQHGGSKVTLVGEPVGDRLRAWGEGGGMVLPNSRLEVRYATGLHDYTRSCWGEPGCFWLNFVFPLSLQSWEPDVLVPYRFADYLALRDPLVERALLLAQ